MTSAPVGTAPSYRDESVDGDWTFELHPDRVLIRGRETFVSTFERTVMLESLCPEIDRTWARHTYFHWGAKVLAVSVAVVYVTWRHLELSVSTPPARLRNSACSILRRASSMTARPVPIPASGRPTHGDETESSRCRQVT